MTNALEYALTMVENIGKKCPFSPGQPVWMANDMQAYIIYEVIHSWHGIELDVVRELDPTGPMYRIPVCKFQDSPPSFPQLHPNQSGVIVFIGNNPFKVISGGLG